MMMMMPNVVCLVVASVFAPLPAVTAARLPSVTAAEDATAALSWRAPRGEEDAGEHPAPPVKNYDPDPWAPVRRTLRLWPNMTKFAFSAGDATGRKFTFERGGTTMQTVLPVASSSKWPAAVAFALPVDAGVLTFDALANEHLEWWTKDANDPRSRVTLRHLLSFSSGFYSPDVGGDVDCLDAVDAATNYTIDACARQIYEQAPFEFEPGTTFSYNSYHLQIAGALVSAATNRTVPDLLTSLFDKANMPSSFYEGMKRGGQNPYLAAALLTTGDDYDSLLRRYLAYDMVSRDTAREMELDYVRQENIANSSQMLIETLGHYSMCLWYECLDGNGTFLPHCREDGIHMDAGLFGWYPLLDRANGTYFQIVQAQKADNTSDLRPTADALELRIAIKPLVDAALATEERVLFS